MKFRTAAIVCALVVSAAGLFPATVSAQATDDRAVSRERTLVVGRISGNPKKHASRLMTLGNHLVSEHESFDRVRVVLIPQPEDMVASTNRGDIDIISETAFSALRLERDGDMEPALLEWKGGVRAYHSLILVRADSHLRKLEDLRGRKIAFEDPGSTSGFFLPYVEIMDAGVEMVRDGSADAGTTRNKLRYEFGGAEINVIGSLVRERVDAAAIGDIDLHDDEVVTERFKPQVRILHETRAVPRSLMLYRSSLPETTKARLTEILLALHETDEGNAILRRYFKLKRFERLTDEDHANIDRLREAFHARHSN